MDNIITAKIWRAGLYIRLSKEDKDLDGVIKNESDSISAQKEILHSYIDSHEDITLVKEYIDDGITGSTSDRPSFKKMLADIQGGRINCVIVKDSSRFMRNAAEASYYKDNYFVKNGVRFITVMDNKDRLPSARKKADQFLSESVNDVINEYYLIEASDKIRATLDSRKRQGKFIGAFASFGYKKDENDYHRLVIDEEASEIVKMIFSMFNSGMSILEICRRLNSLNIPNPTKYKRLKGLSYNHSGDSEAGLWSDQTVRRILKNEIYIGTMVQNKTTKLSYKLKESVALPEDKWIRVENTHEAIIDREEFDKAQELLRMRCRASSSSIEESIFAGLIKCGCCKKAMSKKVNKASYGTYSYYRCVSNTKAGKRICSAPSIRIDVLEKTVLASIQAMVDIAISLEDTIKMIKKNSKSANSSSSLESAINSKEEQIKRKKSQSLELYTDLKDGIIEKEEYLLLKDKYKIEIQKLEMELDSLKEQMDSLSSIVTEDNKFIQSFIQYGKIERLTRSMLLELIDEIVIHNDKSIEIHFKLQDIFKLTVEYISDNKQKTA